MSDDSYIGPKNCLLDGLDKKVLVSMLNLCPPNCSLVRGTASRNAVFSTRQLIRWPHWNQIPSRKARGSQSYLEVSRWTMEMFL
jgi:hypothetical protein